MIKTVKILFFLLFVSGVDAQIKDSVEVKIAIDTISLIQSVDSTFLATKDAAENDTIMKSLPSDSLQKPKMLYIERALLDSLLRPYYNIYVDSTKSNASGRNIMITPKYRMVIDNYSGDTSYIPLPNKINYFSKIKTYGIDTIGFSNSTNTCLS